MRFLRIVCTCLLPLLYFAVALGQSSPQPEGLLQQSLLAQTGGQPITDVTVSGTATFAGQAQGAPVTMTALANGTTKVVFDMPTGTETEVWSNPHGTGVITGSGPSGSVTQAEGGSITMPSPGWLSPALLMQLLSSGGYSSSYVASEKQDQIALQHILAWEAPQASSLPKLIAEQRGRTDLYINSAGLLASAVFQIRSYHKPGGKHRSFPPDLGPEEVRYSDYQLLQGRMIPFAIAVYIGDAPQAPFINIAVSSVTFNTGVTIPALSAISN